MPNYRMIIDAYRSRLMEISPSACNEVDDRMYAAGEKWVSDQRPIDLDALMTATEFAERFGYHKHDARNWANRNPEKVTKYRRGGKVFFLVRELLEYVNSS